MSEHRCKVVTYQDGMLHILRNPHGFSEDVIREARCAAADRIEALERSLSEADAKIARLESDLKACAENEKEMRREHREELRDAVSEARREAETGDPYGTY